jgi:hypothetical protein
MNIWLGGAICSKQFYPIKLNSAKASLSLSLQNLVFFFLAKFGPEEPFLKPKFTHQVLT